MSRLGAALVGIGLLIVAGTGPVGAQADSISVTPSEGLVDGQTVEVSASTTGSNYATLALCPVEAAPSVGTNTTTLLTTRDICVGLVCLHDGFTDPGVLESISADCPIGVQESPIASITTAIALPRVTNDGTDCAVDECVVVFNTWTSSSAQGAVSAVVQFDDTDPATTAASSTTTASPETTTTTIELSAPSITSTVAPTVAPTITTSTVAAQVLGAQETRADELAVTGFDAGMLAALGIALVVTGGGALARSRRD